MNERIILRKHMSKEMKNEFDKSAQGIVEAVILKYKVIDGVEKVESLTTCLVDKEDADLSKEELKEIIDLMKPNIRTTKEINQQFDDIMNHFTKRMSNTFDKILDFVDHLQESLGIFSNVTMKNRHNLTVKKKIIN